MKKRRLLTLCLALIMICSLAVPALAAPNPGIILSVTADNDAPSEGDTVTYTVTVYNSGTNGTQNNLTVTAADYSWSIKQIKKYETVELTFEITYGEAGEYTVVANVYSKQGELIGQSEKLAVEIEEPIIKLVVGDIVTMNDILWRVIDVEDGKALLLSDIVIPIFTSQSNSSGQLKLHNTAKGYTVTLGETSYKDTTLAEDLDVTFYATFSEEDQAKILTSTITSNVSGVANTWVESNHKIFILSKEEVETYFPTNASRIAYDANGTASYYWTRSLGTTTSYYNRGTYVASNGSVGTGLSVNSSYYTRPAMWIVN